VRSIAPARPPRGNRRCRRNRGEAPDLGASGEISPQCVGRI
ncbi:MAG: hypothetical protein AVDCRST_MAG56-5833, partial [uncultured Cytophagales bacterium]